MSALRTIPDQPALPVRPIARDQARALLGQVMGLVAVTVGFTALGAYLGGDLSGATGLLLFIGAFACISASTSPRPRAASNSRSASCSGWACCSAWRWRP